MSDAAALEYYQRISERFPQPPQDVRIAAEEAARNGLEGINDDVMAKVAFYPWQRRFWITVVVVLTVGFILDPVITGSILSAFLVVLYSLTVYGRMRITFTGILSDPPKQDLLHLVADDDLPMYTILMPAYDEPEVIRNLVRAVDEIDYPHDRLELLLLLEEDDHRT